MAKVSLISANVTIDPCTVYPLGMATVSADLQARGHEVSEFDLLAMDKSMAQLSEFLQRTTPAVVGVSLRNLDNCNYEKSISYSDFYKEVVTAIRLSTSCPIVLGGSAFSLFPGLLLEKTGADYGIAGEGEEVFSELIELLEAGKKPERSILKRKIPLAGEEYRAPARNSQLIDYYLKEAGMLNVQTKRGCPFQCAYCSYPNLEGNTYRYRPVDEVVDEIETLVTKHGMPFYFIADSVFNDASGRYLEIAEKIVQRGIDTPWMGYFKPQQFLENEVDLLKLSGLKAVEWGTDCSTDRTLEKMGKNFTWSDVKQSNSLFAKKEIPCAHFIIFGGPGETEQSLQDGLVNISGLEKCVVFASAGVRIIPNTPMQKIAIEEGILQKECDLFEPFFYFSPHVSYEKLHDSITDSFGSRMDRVYPMDRDLEKARAFHRLGHRGPIWDLLLGNTAGRRRRRRV